MSSQFKSLPTTGAVSSVNGQTGVVVLTAADVGAANLALSNLSGTAVNTNINMNSHKLTNVTDPTSDQDAATKKYVDDNSGGSFPLLAPNGTGPAPSYAFASSSNTGMWLDTNTIVFTLAGVNICQVFPGAFLASSPTINLGHTAVHWAIGYIDNVQTHQTRFYNTGNSQYVGFTVDGALAATTSYQLPSVDGNPGDVLSTNGSGVLSWVAP